MDWNHQIEQHRAVLQRIVALLFALAELADRASGRSFRVRCEVLFILSHGEAVARDFILEEAQASRMPILDLPAPAHDDGCSAGDARTTGHPLPHDGRHPGIYLSASVFRDASAKITPFSAFGPAVPGSSSAPDFARAPQRWIPSAGFAFLPRRVTNPLSAQQTPQNFAGKHAAQSQARGRSTRSNLALHGSATPVSKTASCIATRMPMAPSLPTCLWMRTAWCSTTRKCSNA